MPAKWLLQNGQWVYNVHLASDQHHITDNLGAIWAWDAPAAGETGEPPTEQTKQDRKHSDGKEGRNQYPGFSSWDKPSTGLLSYIL